MMMGSMPMGGMGMGMDPMMGGMGMDPMMGGTDLGLTDTSGLTEDRGLSDDSGFTDDYSDSASGFSDMGNDNSTLEDNTDWTNDGMVSDGVGTDNFGNGNATSTIPTNFDSTNDSDTDIPLDNDNNNTNSDVSLNDTTSTDDITSPDSNTQDNDITATPQHTPPISHNLHAAQSHSTNLGMDEDITPADLHAQGQPNFSQFSSRNNIHNFNPAPIAVAARRRLRRSLRYYNRR